MSQCLRVGFEIERVDHANRYVFALTYGSDTDWVRNVLASSAGTLEMRGRVLRLVRPRLFHDERRRSVPVLVRLILSLARVSDFLELTRDEAAEA